LEKYLKSLNNKINEYFIRNKGNLRNKYPIKELYFISFLIYFLNETKENLLHEENKNNKNNNNNNNIIHIMNSLSDNLEEEYFYKSEIYDYIK
jgi:hypothetical protein